MTDAQTQTRVLDAVAEMNVVSLDSISSLDDQSVLLVRFAALVALDAAPLSYLVHLAAGSGAGITEEQVEDVLLAIAPVVGSARIVSAGSKIARAIGIAVLGAEELADEDAGNSNY
jgi:alkylhydroperoxidase/carboxymuconolactone decarboxylase family protein YurZ